MTMNDFPSLTTGSLLLREFVDADAPALFDTFSRPPVTRFHNLPTMRDIIQAEQLITIRAGLFQRGLGLRWAICYQEDPSLHFGSVGLFNINSRYRSIEVGYDLHPDYWRQGIMTAALTRVLDYAFSRQFEYDFGYPLNRVTAMTYPQNDASTSLLRKLGFQEEGLRREYGYWKGAFHDLIGFALLRRDHLPDEDSE